MDGRVGALVVALLVGALAWAAPASAGTYDVHACGTPAEKFTNHSWAISVNGPQFASATCSASDARPYIWVGSSANNVYSGGQGASMTFSAPAGATIANFRIHRYILQFNPIDGSPGHAYLYSLGQLGDTAFESTGHPDPAVRGPLGSRWYSSGEAYEGEATVTKDSFAALAGYRGNATFVRYSIGCFATPCALKTNATPSTGVINVQIFGATVTVNDPTRPAVPRVHPTGLNAGGVVGGDEPVVFDATDNSGIRRAELVDVTPGEPAQVLASDPLRCDYSYAKPCPNATGLAIRARSMRPGTRTLRVRVTDAGGNVAESGALTVQVGGALNGTNASPGARLTATFNNRRSRRHVAYGKRARIRGRVTDATGNPIGGATIQVLDRQLRTGTRYRLVGEITTGADGRFTLLPGRGPARAIRFEYRMRRQLAAPTAADMVTMRVRAGATLSIRPRSVGPNGRIRMSGRLKGGPIPRSGKVIELQAFDGGKWRTFETVRARRSGRYRAAYRFTNATRGRTLTFRARVRRDDSFPYYLGYSNRVRVRIR